MKISSNNLSSNFSKYLDLMFTIETRKSKVHQISRAYYVMIDMWHGTQEFEDYRMNALFTTVKDYLRINGHDDQMKDWLKENTINMQGD